MKVFLTSFRRWHTNPKPKGWFGYSIAVYQPKWFPQLPKIQGFDIRDDGGRWIRPRDFIPPDHDASLPSRDILYGYREALIDLYNSRYESLMDELDLIRRMDVVPALCCWCPYDTAAKRQIEDYGSYICHSAAVEVWLRQRGIKVIRDKDRQNMVDLWSL